MLTASHTILFQLELEESNEKHGAEVEEAEKVIAEVEQLFQAGN